MDTQIITMKNKNKSIQLDKYNNKIQINMVRIKIIKINRILIKINNNKILINMARIKIIKINRILIKIIKSIKIFNNKTNKLFLKIV
jgi:hypothetical protein